MLLTSFQANIEKLSAWERKYSIERKCKEGGNEKEHDPLGDDAAKSEGAVEFEGDLLETSRKMCQDIQSSSSFVYTKKTTNEGQRALLDFWGFLLKHEDKLHDTNISNPSSGTHKRISARPQQLFLDTMKALVLREEFDLAQLRNKSRDEVAGPMPISQEDKDVFNTYRILLQRTIELVVRIFLSEKITREERMFCLELLAISFFRIPTLCGFLLDSADVQEEEEEAQEQGQKRVEPEDGKDDRKGQLHSNTSRRVVEAFKQYKEKAKAEDRKFFSFFENNPSLFDWTVWLQGVNDDWLKSSITKVKVKLSRPENFFPFVSFIVCHVCKISVGQIHFGLVPGYWTLVTAVLERVSRRKAAAYTHTMAQCIADLLQNRSLLAFFAQALLLTTDAFDCASVDKSLNLLDEWFLIVAPDMADPLPGNMCFDTLFDALNILLQSNHFQVLLKTLTFIYMHVGRVYGALRAKLCGLLLEKHFSALFLHWNPEVRLMFHRILVFRLNRLGVKQAGTDKQHKVAGPSASFEHQLLHKVRRVMELDTSCPRVVGEGEDPLTQKGSGGDSKQASKISAGAGGGDSLHVQNRMVQDPSLKHCACVFAPLNNSQLQVDIKLHEALLQRLTELLLHINQRSPEEKKSGGGGSGAAAAAAAAAAAPGGGASPSIDSSLEIQLPAALFEFRNVTRSFLRLQESITDLQPYEVITPEYYFDILPSL